jgi:transposase
MMRPSNTLSEIYLCITPVDFRKGINGLSSLVESELSLDLFSEALFVFTNRRRDKVKILLHILAHREHPF